MQIQDIYFGPDGKPRSGWRFAIFATIFTFAWIFASLIVGAFAFSYTLRGPSLFLLGSIASLIPALLVGWFCARTLEGLPFRSLGASPTEGWMRNLVIGSVLGALALTLAAAIAALLGDLDFSFTGSPAGEIVNSMLFSLVIFAVAAAFEEVLFRGYILQTFIRSDLKWFGVFFTAALFASVHNSNPNAGLISWVNTFIAGVWFGVAYLKTRDLWFVWGLHLFWNWMQGAVFGIEVSGLTEIITASVLRESDRGPEWLTGGNYGIEASIASTIALIVSTAVIYYLPFLRPSDEMMEVQKPAVQKPAP